MRFDLEIFFYDFDYDCPDNVRFYGLTLRQVFMCLAAYEAASGRANMHSILRIS